MKVHKGLLALSLLAVFSSGYRIPEKAAPPVPYITFVNDAGEERTMPLIETRIADWKDVAISGEFRRGDKPIHMEGMLIYQPNGGNSVFYNFKEGITLSTVIQKFDAECSTAEGGLFVLDHLRPEGAKKDIGPWVHWIK